MKRTPLQLAESKREDRKNLAVSFSENLKCFGTDPDIEGNFEFARICRRERGKKKIPNVNKGRLEK